jgi:hypothetical protein
MEFNKLFLIKKLASVNDIIDFVLQLQRPFQIMLFIITCLFAVSGGYMLMWLLTAFNIVSI